MYQTIIALPQDYDVGYAYYYADDDYYYADDDYESESDADGVVGVYTYGASETNSGSSVGGSKIFLSYSLNLFLRNFLILCYS